MQAVHSFELENTMYFGSFRLRSAERLIEAEGAEVRLGGRAFDLLVALVENAGRVVGKRELINRVWPDVTVDDGSLRFHVAGLRRALGDGQGGARYVVNVPGRGYCFVAPVWRERQLPAETPRHASAC